MVIFFRKLNEKRMWLVFLLLIFCILLGGKVSAADLSTPVYRMYSSSISDHFYTIDANEKNSATAGGFYTYEGVAFYAYNTQVSGTSPVYRLYRGYNGQGDHFYTADVNEKNNAVNSGTYTSEGIAFYAYTTQVTGTYPVYRLRAGNSIDHFYTSVQSEENRAVINDFYIYENIAFYLPVGTCPPGSGTACYNFAASDAATCNASMVSRGCSGSCSFGGGCGLSCGSPGPLCAILNGACGNPPYNGVCLSANPNAWGACVLTSSCIPPVNGGWSAWSAFSATCGGGTQARTCNNPAPSGGGANCSGSTSQACNTQACIVDNGCAATTCNTTTCWNNLAWVNGTKVCADNSCAALTCTTSTCWNNLTWIAGTKVCPVNGVCGSADTAGTYTKPTTNLCSTGAASSVTGTGPWSWTCAGTNGGTTPTCNAPKRIDGAWGVWGACSKTCGGGTQTRTCSNPAPANGGLNCAGSTSQACNTQLCADNSCAATTCTTDTCWNNLTWIPGTKTCIPDNGCAANTCSDSLCWNGSAWISGTKACTTPSISFGSSLKSDCSLTLTWNSSNTNSCIPTSGPTEWMNKNLGTSGTLSTILNGNQTYKMSCSNSGGGTSTAEFSGGCTPPVPVDNGCAANTCTTTTCNNSIAIVQGTKVCADNSCASTTCTTGTCWNNLTWIPGTMVCADNSCAATTCTTDTCWNNLAWIPGTKICDNGCAATTCVGNTCNNGIISNAPGLSGTLTTNCTQSTSAAEAFCSERSNCGKSIVNELACATFNTCSGQTNSIKLNTCTSQIGLCPTPIKVTCPPCSLKIKRHGWREVSP